MFEEIYNIFRVELDGEEFDTDDDALLGANTIMREILRQRDWKFLLTSTTFAAGNLSWADIDNFGKVIRVWYDSVELAKAEFDERFDPSFHYYVDVRNQTLGLISDFYEDKALIVDHTFKPDDMELENAPLEIEALNALIAYKMGLLYYRKDQDTTVYANMETKYDQAWKTLIDYDNSL